MTWTDFRGMDSEVYAQRVNRNGVSLWFSNGTPLLVHSADQSAYGAVSDGAGGVIAGFIDDRTGDLDAYTIRLESSIGSPVWSNYGVPFCDIAGDQDYIYLAPDGSGGVIGVWWDERNGPGKDLFSQRVERNGYWGYPCPVLFEVTDVPNDQGGYVTLTWERSRLDAYDDDGVEYYSIWRQLGGLEMQAMLEKERVETTLDATGRGFDGEAYRFVSLEGEMYGFEWIADVVPHYMDSYSYTAATLYDSTALDPGTHIFMVSVCPWDDPLVFWDSPPTPGYSVDNLAPCMPLALGGEVAYSPSGLELTWSPGSEPDLGGYRIYRDIGLSFIPGPGNILETTCDTLFFDSGWFSGAGYCYKVSAVDVHGNESEYAVLTDEQITGDEPIPVPDATFLAQNFPNPFNPRTTISFGLKEKSNVSLKIYDTAGRLVTSLVDDSLPAGEYLVDWNGLDKGGKPVASGVFLYKLVAGKFVRTRKMVLLR
jgi:hypothetical protein